MHHAELALISGNGPDDLDESLRFLEHELHLGDLASVFNILATLDDVFGGRPVF